MGEITMFKESTRKRNRSLIFHHRNKRTVPELAIQFNLSEGRVKAIIHHFAWWGPFA